MKEKHRSNWLLLIFPLLLFWVLPSEGQARAFFKNANFSRVVFIGDSLTAGFQSGGLSSQGQLAGYGALIASQAGFDITLPIVSEPGIPPKLQLIATDPLTIERAPDPGSRLNVLEQATNLAVPGHSVSDALIRRPADDDIITSVVLGFPGIFNGTLRSQIEWAEALSPTFAFVWIGNNDVLAFATSGGTEPMTPIDEFELNYQELLDRLESTGADLIMANIPDVTDIAFFLSAEAVAALLQLEAQPRSVVDLAVADDDPAPVLAEDGLVAGLEADDGEAAHDDAAAPVGEAPLVVGSPMLEGPAHGVEACLELLAVR